MTEDWIAIRELTARYNRAADDGDEDAFVSLFAESPVWELIGDPKGDLRITDEAGLRGLVAKGLGDRVHMTTDAIIEIIGGTATQECTLLLVTRAPERPLGSLFTGRCFDELVRTVDGWRFKRRTITIDFARGAQLTLRGAAG